MNTPRMLARGMTAPPRWVQLLVIPPGFLLDRGMFHRHGWVVGVIALIVYGGGFTVIALRGDAVARWSKAHPILDGARLGVLGFPAIAYLTTLSRGGCVAAALVAAAVGATPGAYKVRRRRRRVQLGPLIVMNSLRQAGLQRDRDE